MPFVTLDTNVPVPADINQKLTALLAASIPEKPAALFAITVNSTKNFTFGGVDTPAAALKIRAFSIFNPDSNKVYSKKIADGIEKLLGVPSDRLLIAFVDIPTSHCGFNGTTCDTLF